MPCIAKRKNILENKKMEHIITKLLPPLRVIKGISLAFTAFGLLLVLKCCIFDISSDAEIVYPYAGEILTVSTGLHLLTMILKEMQY